MLVSCQNRTSKEILVETTGFVCQTLDNQEVSYNGNIINDKNTAEEYANLILSKTLQKNIEDYKVVDVSFDSNKNIWIVNYLVDEYTLGGDVVVKISRNDGKVKEIRFGE